MGNLRDWKTCTDEKEKYQLYLASREWGVLREQVISRAGGQCERCVLSPIDAVHHLSYARKYNELPEDLQGLCSRCHSYTHGKSDEDPNDDIYALQLKANSSMTALVAVVCPVCKGHMTSVSDWRSQPLNGHPSFRLTVRCHSLDDCVHEFDIAFLEHGPITAITTTHFRIINPTE